MMVLGALDEIAQCRTPSHSHQSRYVRFFGNLDRFFLLL